MQEAGLEEGWAKRVVRNARTSIVHVGLNTVCMLRKLLGL